MNGGFCMTKKSAQNSELLKSVKNSTTPQIYDLLLDLVNEDREDLAENVLKADYLLDYAGTCIRQKDLEEGRETLEKTKARIDALRDEKVNTEYLEYLYEGLLKKIKK
jgi:hypothetical protein